MAKWGWIAYGVGVALAIVALVGFIALGVSGAFDDGYSSDPDYTY